MEGNLNVARQVGEQVRRYISTNHKILLALAADLDATNLSAVQQDQILKNYALRFPEFRELSVFDERGAAVATSRAGAPTVKLPPDDTPVVYGVRMSPVYVDADLLPTSLVAVPPRAPPAAHGMAGRRVQHRGAVAARGPHPRRHARATCSSSVPAASCSRTATPRSARASRAA